MKKSVLFYSMFISSLLFFNCEDKDKVEYTILAGACGTIELNGNIGDDFYSALDSLNSIKEPLLTGGCPGNPCYNYYIDTDTLTIDFTDDDRDFLGVTFKNVANNLSVFAMSDVLDTKGNYYSINWCED